jgi:uncharacterized membrane protein
MLEQNKHSTIGILSLIIAIINIILSVIIFWALWSYINQMFWDIMVLQVQLIKLGPKVEFILKPLGIILGLIALFDRNKSKKFAIIGIIINIMLFLWTLALIYGLII